MKTKMQDEMIEGLVAEAYFQLEKMRQISDELLKLIHFHEKWLKDVKYKP